MPAGALELPTGEADFLARFDGRTAAQGRFLAGPENRILLRACEEFGGSPTCPYNPLVLHGPAGSGKSLLSREIGALFANSRPGAAVLYLSGADFAAEFAHALETRSIPAWRRSARDVALLVIDDLGPLAAKRPAQVELLNTIDEICLSGGQVLVTASQAVGQVAGLLPALVSRLMAGLTMAIAAAGPVARRAALEQAALDREFTLAADAAELLAAELPVTIPELFGALHELHSHSKARPIDRRQVERYLSGRRATDCPSIREIASCVARQYGVDVARLRGPSRRQNIVAARGAAMYLSRQLTGKSLGVVGRFFGGRDHTTVLHACRKTEQTMADDAGFRESVTDLRKELLKKAGPQNK